MVCIGAPRRRDDHATLMAGFALEIMDYLKYHVDLSFRVGINSGPAIAGVIGEHKFHFDLWSDTVNTASRMESHGIPSKIQIGEKTYQAIKNDYECEERGEIEIKGKGLLKTWFLIKQKSKNSH